MERQQPSLELLFSLSRLLVPCMHYRGSGRHLVLEPWTPADLRGETLPNDVRTMFARELSAEQAAEFRAISAGQKPPVGTLAELFWAAQTDLPALPPVFDDPELSRLVKALYLFLVPAGEGLVEVELPAVAARIEQLRTEGFAPLRLDIPARRVPSAFRKLLAVTVHHASQLTGAVAEELIAQRLLRACRAPLTSTEQKLLALRYGACPALNDINVGFLFGCGSLLADLINDYFLTLASGSAADQTKIEEELRKALHLLLGFQQRRKTARAHERREDRQRHADRMPVGPRHQAEFHPDDSVPLPEVGAAIHEEMDQLRALLPLLKKRDAARLQAFIECNGDRKAAAARLGRSPSAYSRQLRQTVFPAIRKLAQAQGLELASEEDAS